MVEIIQININKCKNAHDCLFRYLTNNPGMIALIQEPYSYQNKIICPRGYTIYGMQHSRAIIVAPMQCFLFFSYELSSLDHTVVYFKNGKKSQFLVSVYLDITKPCISPELAKI